MTTIDEAALERIRAECDEHRREQLATEREQWIESLDPKDWLLNGEPVKGDYMMEKWDALDWSKAYMDMGPSPIGNPGPYWHVPCHIDGDDLVMRLYPQVLRTKWLLTIRQAVEEAYRSTAP